MAGSLLQLVLLKLRLTVTTPQLWWYV